MTTPLVQVNASEAAIAEKNGHPVYAWTGTIQYAPSDWNIPATSVVPAALSVGVNAGNFCWGTPATNTSAMQMLKLLGATYIRAAIPWNYSQGHWTSLYQSDAKTFDSVAFSAVASFAQEAKTYGLTPIFVIDGLIAPAGVYPSNPQYDAGYPVTPQDFALACAQLAKDCPGVKWEIINEPNYYATSSTTTLLTPSVYVEALKAAYSAMKVADPTCVVHLGPVSDLTFGGSGYVWLSNIYALGIVGFFDVFSFHLYTWRGNRTWGTSDEGPLNVQISAINSLRAKFLDATPSCLSETGWQSLTTNSGDTDPEMTPELQSQYLVSWLSELKTMYPNPEVVLIYCLQDYDAPGGDWGLVEIDGVTLKPSFSAVQSFLKG